MRRAMPAVEKTPVSYLSRSSALSLKTQSLPTRPVRLTSSLLIRRTSGRCLSAHYDGATGVPGRPAHGPGVGRWWHSSASSNAVPRSTGLQIPPDPKWSIATRTSLKKSSANRSNALGQGLLNRKQISDTPATSGASGLSGFQ